MSCGIFDQIGSSCNISARPCDSAAGILNEGSRNYIGANLNGFCLFGEFAVAVVNGDDNVFPY